jgi:hypothetical protein
MFSGILQIFQCTLKAERIEVLYYLQVRLTIGQFEWHSLEVLIQPHP